MDLVLQALSDMKFDTSKDNDGEEDLIDTAQEMKLFEASKLQTATNPREEEELLEDMSGMGLKNKRKRNKDRRSVGGIQKAKRYDPKKGRQNIKTTQQNLTRAVAVAAAAGLESWWKKIFA